MEATFVAILLTQFVYHWWTVHSLNHFWGKQVQALTEKLMSRDIVEYKQALAPPLPKLPVTDGVALEDFGALPNFTL